VAEVRDNFGAADASVFPAVWYALVLGTTSAFQVRHPPHPASRARAMRSFFTLASSCVVCFVCCCGFECAVQGVCMNHFFLHGYRYGTRARVGTTQLVFDKVTRISLSSLRGEVTTGAILNMASNDTRRLVNFSIYTNFLWIGIAELVIALGMLYQEVGVSALAGVAVMVLLMPLQIAFAKRVGQLQATAVQHTDHRTRAMGEILKSILLVKLNVYERSFANAVARIRGLEIKELHHSNYAQAVNVAVFFTAPLAATAATFAVYSQVQDDPLDAPTAFACLAWANVMMRTLIVLPRGAAAVVEGLVSMRRINNILSVAEKGVPDGAAGTSPTKPPTLRAGHTTGAARATAGATQSGASLPLALPGDGVPAGTSAHSSVAVRMRGSFAWATHKTVGDAAPVLHNLQLDVAANSLAVVVGPVAAGKSSLLSAMLGELCAVHSKGDAAASGEVAVRGQVALVPQQAWILNMSLRDNICFGQPFDAEKMARVVDACCLRDDVARLPAGLDTEIGENGTTLSGGQRQRVSLARAVYLDADVYLLDDVLSALDARVGRQVFQRVLSNEEGILSGKTRVVVTHAQWTLPHADTVVVLQDGVIKAVGTHAELEGGEVLAHALATPNPRPRAVSDGGASTQSAGRGRSVSASTVGSASSAGSTRDSDGAGGGGDGKLVQAEETGRASVGRQTYARYIRSGGGFFKFTLIVILFVLAQATRIGADWWLARWSTQEWGLSQMDFFWGTCLSFAPAA